MPTRTSSQIFYDSMKTGFWNLPHRKILKMGQNCPHWLDGKAQSLLVVKMGSEVLVSDELLLHSKNIVRANRRKVVGGHSDSRVSE